MFKHSISKATYAAMLATGISLCGGVDADRYESLHQYCQSSWQRAGIPRQDWGDCTHDAIVELLADANDQKRADVEADRALKRCVWRVAKRWQREKRPYQLDDFDPEASSAGSDERQATTATESNDPFEGALSKLSGQQREILERWSTGQSIHQIAADLTTTSAKVSNQKYKAIHKLKRMLTTIANRPETADREVSS